MDILDPLLLVPVIALDDYEIDRRVVARLSALFCRENQLIPVSSSGTHLIVAMVDPCDEALLGELALRTGCEIDPVRTTADDVARAIRRVYGDPLS